MKRDYILTFLTQAAVLASGLLVYRLAADFLGKEIFSVYALSRRTISFILPALSMGLGVGLPRYIAYAYATRSHKNPNTYLLTALITLLLVSLIFALVFNIFDDKFSFLFFGSSTYSHLIFPMTLMIIGSLLHSTCYSYYRGKLLMVKANALQMINMAIVPPIVFLFFGDLLSSLLTATGTIWLATSGLFIVFILLKQEKTTWKTLYTSGKQLMSYSVIRVPGDFAMSAILTLPATFTAHTAGVREAGYVAFGVSLLNMIGYSFSPISTILLPKASQMIAEGHILQLRNHLFKLLKVSLCLNVAGVILFVIFAQDILSLYLGFQETDVTYITRIIVLASVPYTLYILLRSILDAKYVKPVNTINILISFSVLVGTGALIYLTTQKYFHFVIAFAFTMSTLGTLTFVKARAVLK